MKVGKGLKLVINVISLALACLIAAESLVFFSGLMVRPPLEGLENQLFDLAFQVRKENRFHQEINPDRIVIIDIDDASIEKLGRAQLWPRSFDARVIRNISSGHPSAIGIDFLYTESDTLSPEYAGMLKEKGFENSEKIIKALSTDDELANAIADAGNVYLSFFDDDTKADIPVAASSMENLRMISGNSGKSVHYPRLNHPVLPVSEFASAAKGIGSISMPSMQDGTVRHYRLLQELPGNSPETRYIGNFPLYMMIDALKLKDSEISVQDNGLRLGNKAFIPLSENGSFRINWLGSEEKFRYISYYKILNELIPPEFFEDKFVFLGTSASGLQDLKTIPARADKTPGVEVHAVAFLNLMNNAFLEEISERQAFPYFAILSVLLVSVFLFIRPLLGFAVSIALVFGEMFVFVLWALPEHEVVFPIVTLMLLTFFSYISASLFTYFIREKKNRRLKSAFGSYVSPAVVNQIIKDASALNLGGEKKRLTVLFSDIRGFTSYSEQLDPQELVAVLNNYLSQMSEVIFKYNGTIDKFIGDAIMAIFGAPLTLKNHADSSCYVALDMISRLEKVNLEHAERGQPPLSIGIGLNTGDMTVGNIGSQKRFDYTVIGDAVNLGSRLEGLTKFFGVHIIVSETTKNESTTEAFIFRELASVRVVGKENPVVVYELMAVANPSNPYKDQLAKWNKAFEFLKLKQLNSAHELFIQYLEMVPEDIPARYYIKQCELYMERMEEFSMTLKMDSK